MNHDSSSSRRDATLDHLQRHWETRRRAVAAEMGLGTSEPDTFTIALSREAGTDGTAIAHAVGSRLDWPVYDYKLLERIAREMGVHTALLKTVDEKQKSWLLEAMETFVAVPLVSESAYVQHLIKSMLALSTLGECVIVGRGAAFMLPAKTTLRVRLVAPLKERITVLSRRLHISEREAARQVRTRDRERADFVEDHFLKDPSDPCQYDLLLNTSCFSVDACAELIIDALRCRQMVTTRNA